jgi:hypothetical protein
MKRKGLSAAVLVIVALIACPLLRAERPATETKVQAALDEVHRWVGDGQKGQGWRKFLKSDLLTAELDKGELADPKVLAEVLAQYESGKPGLDRPRFQAVREALVAWNAELTQIAPQDLPKAARDAAGAYRPVTPQEVGQSKAELAAALRALEVVISGRDAQNTAAWKNFLQWNDLAAIVNSADAPSAEVVDAIVERFKSDAQKDGKPVALHLPQFTRARTALENYAATSAAAADANLQEQYGAQLEELAKHLEAYAQDPASGDAGLAAGRTVGWLERNRQARDLVVAIRRAYLQPNVFGYASQRLAASGIEDDINEVAPVRDNIMGTSIFGTAHLTGRTRLVLLENPRAAAFNVFLAGQATSNNVGYNRGVTLHTSGLTQVSGTKYLQMNDLGMSGAPAIACCQTHTHINDICAKGPFVERIAWKRAGKSKGQAEAIASDHAEIRIANQMNERSARLVNEQNDRYVNKFRNPLIRRNSFPQNLTFSSHPDRAEVRALQASSVHLGAPTAPPPVAETHDLALRAHESAVANFGEGILSNYYLTDYRLEEILRDDLKREVPEELRVTDDKDPWAIRFARELPVRAKFSGGKVSLAIRVDAFYRGQDDRDSPYNKALDELIEISAEYGIERTAAGATLRRDGDVRIRFPNRPNPDQITARDTPSATFLRRKFRNLFKEEFVGEGLTFKGRWARAGTLKLQELNSDAAWLTVGWTMPAPGSPPADVPPAEAAPPAAAATPPAAAGGGE